jgi:hypothetical protein
MFIQNNKKFLMAPFCLLVGGGIKNYLSQNIIL